MQRDSFQLVNNDFFSVGLDTFYDRRNGVTFLVNAIGGFMDFAITDEDNPNMDWNAIWDVRTGRFDGGWTVEMEVPFKSLRFPAGPSQTWGLHLGRNVRRKSETSFLTPVPINAFPGQMRLSAAGTLTGVEVPEGNRIFEVKPYAIGSVATDLNAVPRITNEGDGNAGLDVKYGVTQNLTADFTLNTDFAQVEVDEQQVNLTRFNLFFPEKREFFLEGQGIFDFGRPVQPGGRVPAPRRLPPHLRAGPLQPPARLAAGGAAVLLGGRPRLHRERRRRGRDPAPAGTLRRWATPGAGSRSRRGFRWSQACRSIASLCPRVRSPRRWRRAG